MKHSIKHRRGRSPGGGAHERRGPGRIRSILQSSSLRSISRFAIFLYISSTLLISCDRDRHLGPANTATAEGPVILRYRHTPRTTYTYRRSKERLIYGAASGDVSILKLECRESSGDIESFALIDSLLYTTNLTSRFAGGQRTAGSFRMTPNGDLPGSSNPFADAAQPLVPLPGLPAEPLQMHSSVLEERPYPFPLSQNARLLTSTRQRSLSQADDGNGVVLREEILQVVETRFEQFFESDTTVILPASRHNISWNDTLLITREIRLSSNPGHLVSSVENEREVHFIPSNNSTGLTGRYTINESTTRFELVDILTQK